MTEVKPDIPYIAYESAVVRADRANKRLWILCIILMLMLLLTNVAWALYESQFEEVETTTIEQEVETGDNGGDTIVNGIGDVSYGENKAEGDRNKETN